MKSGEQEAQLAPPTHLYMPRHTVLVPFSPLQDLVAIISFDDQGMETRYFQQL